MTTFQWFKDMSETACFFGIRDHEYQLLQGMLNNLKVKR